MVIYFRGMKYVVSSQVLMLHCQKTETHGLSNLNLGRSLCPPDVDGHIMNNV